MVPNRPSTAYRTPKAAVPSGYQTMAVTRDVVVPLALFWALLLPAGLAIDLAGVLLPPYRLVALATLPMALYEIVRRQLRLAIPDYLIIAGTFWAFIAMFMNSSIDKAIQGGGSFFLDSLGPYLVGRAYLTDVRRLRTFLAKALPGVILIAVILAVESISHKLLIAPLFPQRARMELLYETRFGLLRARATFPHSISAGIFMTSVMPLYYLSGLAPRTRWAGFLASLGAVFSVSSSAFLTLILTTFLLAYRAVFTVILRMRERMIYLFYLAVAVIAALQAFTGRGAARLLVEYLTINSSSGYYRIVTWNYGTLSVEKHPWFGIGDASLERARWMIQETIDNHWLMLAVKYGLPTVMLIGVGVVASIWRCGRNNQRLNGFDRATTLGAAISLTTSSIVAWTGALWANNIAWYMLVAGIVGALGSQLAKRPAVVRAPTLNPRPATPVGAR